MLESHSWGFLSVTCRACRVFCNLKLLEANWLYTKLKIKKLKTKRITKVNQLVNLQCGTSLDFTNSWQQLKRKSIACVAVVSSVPLKPSLFMGGSC